MMRAALLVLIACLDLSEVASAAYVDVQFRPQDGDLGTATEWAVEMISDTPVGSIGIYIANVDPYTSSFYYDPPPPPFLIYPPGILATIDADVGVPGLFNATWFGLPRGLILNLSPDFPNDRLGPANTWLFLGMLGGVTKTDIEAGAGGESGLWADYLGNPIPASDVHYTFPEPTALLLLALGLAALALLRGRHRV